MHFFPDDFALAKTFYAGLLAAFCAVLGRLSLSAKTQGLYEGLLITSQKRYFNFEVSAELFIQQNLPLKA